MAVTILTGDLFVSPAQTLVNAVNCVGVMGKGVALEFKQRYPAMYADYARRCAAGFVRPGEPYLFAGPTPPWILNFPTKRHWRSPSRLEDIVAGLAYLEDHYQAWEITSLATPALGCGAANLAWRDVGPILYQRLNRLAIPVELYAPVGTPDDELSIK